MKYMMLVIADPEAAAEAEPRAATTVQVSRGQLLVSDGPFVESKEWICGFDILECDDLDEAIAIAARHPQANGGKLELRPFWTDEV